MSAAPANARPLDVVYTWIDDSFPGFQEERRRYARGPHDLNPNRTRDNLDLLKYSLRSLEMFAPWRGTVWIVTSRPQMPRWLNADRPGVRMIYLDEIMPPELLPCFNAFSIESFIHAHPAISQRYMHFNDDMLLAAPVERRQLETDEGRLRYYFSGPLPPVSRIITEKDPPFEGGLVNVARALQEEFGPGRYPKQAHHPRIIDKSDMMELIARFPEEFARTRAARFRAHDTILPHMLLAAYLVQKGRADYVGPRETKRLMRFVRLRNHAMWNALKLAWTMRAPAPGFLALNDDFGAQANSRAEAAIRRFLERHYPKPSSYEHAAP